MSDSLRDRAEQLLKLAEPLKQAENRAIAFQAKVPKAALYVGIAGCQLDSDSLEVIPPFLSVRRVSNPPGIVHVCRAANLKETDYLGVSRHSGHIQAEILVANLGSEGLEAAHDLAWHLAALLKLQGFDLLCCPASASVSWDTVAAVADQSVTFHLLDDLPRQIGIQGLDCQLNPEHLFWAGKHYESAFRLRDHSSSRRFGLAFNLAYTWNHTGDPRLALVNVWSALEALFGDKNDSGVTRALTERISRWMPARSPEDIRALYKRRCDVVHGRWIDMKDLRAPLEESIQLLRGALRKCIDSSSVPLPDWKA